VIITAYNAYISLPVNADRSIQGVELVWRCLFITFEWEYVTGGCSWFGTSCYIGVLLHASGRHLCHDPWT